MERAQLAIKMFEDRQDAVEYPKGHFDPWGIWWPNHSELCRCCLGIGRPSKEDPFVFLRHCRSYVHCICLAFKKTRYKYRRTRAQSRHFDVEPLKSPGNP